MKQTASFTLAILGSIIFVIGYLFKIMHWAYSTNLIFSGGILIVIGGGYYLYLNRKN
jgi:hypothetical protein